MLGLRPVRHVSWAITVSCLVLGGRLQAQSLDVREDGARVVVRTLALELTLERGAVVGLRDLRTGEVFCDAAGADGIDRLPSGCSSKDDWWTFRQAWLKGTPEVYASDAACKAARRRPLAGVAPRYERMEQGLPFGTQHDGGLVRYRYSALSGGREGDTLLFCFFTEVTGSGTGELVLTPVCELGDPGSPPLTLDVPLLGLRTPGVILGSGARYARDEDRAVDCTTRVANGLYSPNAAVIEGKRGVVALWVESSRHAPANVWLAHTPEQDALVLNTSVPRGGRPAYVRDPTILPGARWRFGVFPDWESAARRYRQRLHAEALWEHPCTWVRDIHAVATHIPTPATAAAHYERLAGVLEPAKTLLFYWNGSYIILFGDHRYQVKSARPAPPVIEELRKHGFRWVGYHPYTLIMPPSVQAQRLEDLGARGELPEGYEFAPDYGGPPERFHEFFRPVCGGYYKPLDEARLWVIHAGTQRCREYLARNLGNYCKQHRMSGAYLDILGSSSSSHFPPELKVQESFSWRAGEASLLDWLRGELPDVGFMSEYQNEWTIGGTFYSWTGSAHVHRQKEVGTRLNHPLRTALWGSYTWTREDELDPAHAVLIGALPHVDVEDEWQVARARLYAQEELWPDIPEVWGEGVLAYFRAKQGRWFAFRTMPWGDAFTEETPDGPVVRLGRLRGVGRSPLQEPVTIPGWVAYEGDGPVGLDPERTYGFLIGRPPVAEAFRIVRLPPTAHVVSARHAKTHSVVELGSSSSDVAAGTLRVIFARRCLRVCRGAADVSGPFEAGTAAELESALPGGLVFVWEEPKSVAARFQGKLAAETGRLRATGVLDGAWCYNSSIRTVAMPGEELPQGPAISIGYGRYRGHSGAWVDLVAGCRPELRFETRYATGIEDARTRRLTRSVVCSAAVNGERVWETRLGVDSDWAAHRIPLTGFTGRKVLVSLSVQAAGAIDVPASHRDAPVLFRRVRVDRNPHPLSALQGLSPPGPATEVLRGAFDGPDMGPGWDEHVSDGHRGEAGVAVQRRMACFTGEHYKHVYLSRPWPPAATSVQALAVVPATGCAANWNPGLGLIWPGGGHTFFTGGGYGGREALAIRGCGARYLELPANRMRVGEDDLYRFWLRIRLTGEGLVYEASLDGKTWVEQAVVSRPEGLRVPPATLVVGRGMGGVSPLFSNDERWDTNLRRAYMDEVIIGRGQPVDAP